MGSNGVKLKMPWLLYNDLNLWIGCRKVVLVQSLKFMDQQDNNCIPIKGKWTMNYMQADAWHQLFTLNGDNFFSIIKQSELTYSRDHFGNIGVRCHSLNKQ